MHYAVRRLDHRCRTIPDVLSPWIAYPGERPGKLVEARASVTSGIRKDAERHS